MPVQVRDKATGELVQNLTSASPKFLVRDLPPANMLAGLNLTVYTATIGGTINTVETLGVFTSKVAELQVVSVEANSLPLGGLGAGLGLLLTLLILLTLVVVRVRVSAAGGGEGTVEVQTVPRTDDSSAYTVYDKVDLLGPGSALLSPGSTDGEDRGGYGYPGDRDHIPPGPPGPPPNCRGHRGGTPGGHREDHRGHRDSGAVSRDSGAVSVDSLSSLLSDLHHQESVL